MSTAILAKLAAKYAYRIPELLARAAAGDPTAIAILSVLGVAAVATYVKGKDS